MRLRHPALVPALLILLGCAVMAAGRASVTMPLALAGQTLLLLGARRASPRVLLAIGFPALWAAAVAVFVGSAKELFGGIAPYAAAMAVAAMLSLIALAGDRWLHPRLPATWAALAYPAIRTPMEVAAAMGGPFGAWASFAAPAAGWWPLTALVSYGGMFLLSFALLWLASALAGALDGAQRGHGLRAFGGLAVCLACLGLGAALTARHLPEGPTMRVAALAVPEVSEAYTPAARATREAYGAGRASAAQIEAMRPALMATARQAMAGAETAARRGARAVYTAEGDIKILDLDLPAVEAMGSETARRTGIWLGLGVDEFSRAPRPLTDMILLFSPDGRLVSRYEKSHPIGDEKTEMQIGDGSVSITPTPSARIAGIVCYDTEFLAFTRRIARQGADILFAPSNDWRQIAAVRGALTRFRALETGLALVRPTRNGVSEIVASDGRILAAGSYDPRTGVLLVADVAARATPTPYDRLGDWVGPASAALLICLLGAALLLRKGPDPTRQA